MFFSTQRIAAFLALHASRIIGVSVMLIGSLVLSGWILGFELLESLFMGATTMKVNTALCMLLGGGVLYLLGNGQEEKGGGRPGSRSRKFAHSFAQFGAILIAMMGLVTLGQWFLGWQIGLDQLFFYESPSRFGAGLPGRMAPLTAINFVLLGTAFFTLSRQRNILFAQSCAAVAGFIALVGGLGQAVLAALGGGYSFYTPMALSTALAFILLSTGIFCVQTRAGFSQVFEVPVRTFFRFVEGTTFLLLLGLIVTLGFLVSSERESEANYKNRHRSFLLADELRQSSDDLTRFARAYVVTANPVFEQFYWQILAIRNGTAPRPPNYQWIYWDFVAAGELPTPVHNQGARMVSLLQLMREAGFPKPELDKLRQALERSNTLVKTEDAAFHEMKGWFDDGTGKFTKRAPPNQAHAIQLLFSTDYFAAKAGIMRPIHEFLQMVEGRMATGAAADEQRNATYFLLITAILSALFALTLFSGYLIFQRVCTPIELLEEQSRMVYNDIGRLAQVATEIAHGNLSQSFATHTRPLHSLARDEIGRLSRTQDEMVRQLQRVGSAIAGITSDLSQRTASLNQSNAQLHQKIAERQMYISQCIEAEKKVEVALKKEVILKREIHHRVKNNLQVIISLLFLQSDQITDPKAREVLRECQSRIRSIALIYSLLSGAEDLIRIKAVDYFRRLTADLLVSYRVDPGQITLAIDAGELFFSVDSALPCGLIITELVSNSLKYAFAGGRQGHIQISLHPAEPAREQQANLVCLRVEDDGVGLPQGFQIEKATSMGLTLVRDLTRQLNGSLQICGGPGTSVTVLIPREVFSKA